jgi:predicted ATPase
MFRLISLNFQDTVLGHVPEDKLVFVPEDERTDTRHPFTSVLIGQNGSGKSTLLYYIAEIFQDIKHYQINGNRNEKSKINFIYTIEFQFDTTVFKISQRRNRFAPVRRGKLISPWFYYLSIDGKELHNDPNAWHSVQLPSNVVAVCYLPLDRFSKKTNLSDDYYLYLGLVDKTNAARPRGIINNALPLLFDIIRERRSVGFLRDILHFMQVDQNYLGIKNTYRYKEYFFNGKLTEKEFIALYKEWQLFSKRKDKPFGVQYFETNIAMDMSLISRIVRYLNVRSLQDQITVGKKSLLEFNLFDNPELLDEWELLMHLKRLDLIESFTLQFRKSRELFVDDFKLSSGEFHYFTTIIAICGSMRQNNLILIDEPETSFHPNWEMKYVNHLKNLLEKWNSSHLIITTHSHFIVSDLEGKSSEVIAITGLAPNISIKALDRNTYGWSAEDVLFKVFNLRSSRNNSFEITLGELLHHLSHKSLDKERIIQLYNELKNSELDRNDPLTQILNEADEYIRNLSY